MTPSLRKRTPLSRSPLVTPVAANRQSPLTMSSMPYFLRGSLMPILMARSRFSSVSSTSRHCIWPPMQRSAAAAYIDIAAGAPGVGGVDHAGDVAVGDEAHRTASLAHRSDQVGVARAIENEGGDVFRGHPFGFGQRRNVVLGRGIEIDHPFGIARSDRNLLHIDIGRIEEGSAFRQRQRGDRAGHVLGAQ